MRRSVLGWMAMVGACGPRIESVADASSDGSSWCPEGTEHCACAGAEACAEGLVCSLGICVAASGPDSTSDAGTSTSTGEGSTGEGSTSDGSSGPASATTDDTTSAEGSSGDESGIVQTCGDGELDPGEACDDANLLDGDGCNADCERGGQAIWKAVLDSGLGLDDYGARVAVDGQDSVVVVAGRRVTNVALDGWVIKLDDDGQSQWDDLYDGGLADSNDGFTGVAVGPGDVIVVVGRTMDAEGSMDAFVRCYTSGGAEAWTHVEALAGDNVATEVFVDAEANVVVAGSASDAEGLPVAWFGKFTLGGEPLWRETFAVAGPVSAVAVAVDSSGSIFQAEPDAGVALRKISPQGLEQWTLPQQAPSTRAVLGLAIDPNDDVFSAGSVGTTKVAELERRFGGDGALDWSTSWAGGYHAVAIATAIAVDAEGRPVIAGLHGDGSGTLGIFVRKLDATGEQLWLFEEEGLEASNDGATGVAITPPGHVVVSGRQRSPNGDDDVWVVKLSP